MKTILQVENLITRFYSVEGIIHALNGVSFNLQAGEVIGIVGESGSGKSVTMLSLVGLIPEPQGKIEEGKAIFDDGYIRRDLLKLSEKELQQIRGAQIGFIFQDPISSLNPVMRIGDQIAESMMIHFGISKTDAKKRAIDLLERVGIADASSRYRSYPHEFSGGMRQRVMIAIALACNPKVVIADEPTTALDVTVQAQIVTLMKQLQAEYGMSVVWISHDLGVVAGIAERVIVMYGGTIVEDALVDDLYEHPQHPYTLGLLAALPSLEDQGDRTLVSIEGTPPDLLQPLTHCPFANRCTYVLDKCLQGVPPLIALTPQHHVACFYDVERGVARQI